MAATCLPPDVEAFLAAHGGMVTAAQLRRLGANTYRRGRWVAAGLLIRGPGRVYATPHTDRFAPLRAALLRAPGAALGMATAAALHGLDGFAIRPDEITLVGPYTRVTKSWRVIQRPLDEADVVEIDGLRVTSVARTLADLAAIADAALVERATECALRRGLVTLEELRAVIDRVRCRGRAGPRVLERLLDRRGDVPPTESDAETRALQVLRHAKLPEPRRQVPIIIDGHSCYRVDLEMTNPANGKTAWIEIDGATTHATREALTADLHRQNELTAFEPRLVRYTAEDVRRHGAHVRRQVWQHLEVA